VTPGKCTPAVCSIDIYPTLIEACNLPPVENQLAGNSLMPLLKNTSATWNKPCISTFLPGNFVIHSGPWNFIQYADGSRELYNVKNDENEFINLAKTPEYKAITDSLSSFLPRSWNQGVQQTTDAEESLPNKAKINKKKNRIRKK
jgi:arylsulfatase A-like enzyme